MEQTRQVADALGRRDFGALVSFCAPNAFFESSGGSTFEGLADIREFWEGTYAPFEEVKNEVVESLDLGNDVSLIVVDMRPRPAGGCAEIQMRLGIVGVVVEGLIERQTNYFDIDEGRAAAERLAWGRR